ncbi:MAG: lytic transglycosylase domain-containing protein [Candidatus Ozemobacteraceae bacterium]
MLEHMKSVFDRISEINSSFEGMAPRRPHRQKAAFAAALNEAKNAGPESEPSPVPTSSFGKPFSAKSGLGNEIPASLLESLTPDSDPTGFLTQIAPLITSHAAKNNLDPALVRRIIEVESDFNPRAVSSKGAMGLMQLMPDTAKELGVKNPFDPEQNISAGTRYLAQLLQSNGGNLKRALASYNAGPGVVRQYGGIPPYAETKNFIRRVLSKLPGHENSTTD